MITGSLNLKLRPIRFAFIIPPYNKKALLEAVRINSVLWGGFFNPIIPLFKKPPKQWKERLRRQSPFKKIIEGYIEAFDPDYIVEIGNAKAKSLNIGGRKVLNSIEILSDLQKYHAPNYGIGLFEILNNLYNKELKFKRTHPFTIYKAILDKKHFSFLACLFGSLHKDVDHILENKYKKALGIKDINCSISNYHELLTKNHFHLRLLTYDSISTTKPWFFKGNCIYLLDAENYLDLVDYWNIRALGWNVIPVAKQVKDSNEIKKMCLNYIEENYVAGRHDCKTSFLNSRSTTINEIEDFIKSLNIDSKEKCGRVSFPTFWNAYDRVHNDCACCEISSDESNIRLQILEQQQDFHFKSLSPEQLSDYPSLKPKFANEINLSLFSSKEPLAEVFPDGYQTMSSDYRFTGFADWRFSHGQPIYYSTHKEENVLLPISSSEDVFRDWMKANGWEIELSSAGIIAKQVLEQFGSINSIRILQNTVILELLEKMNNSEKPLNKKEMFSFIGKAINNREIIKNENEFLERLIKVNMFQLGATLQCPICTRHSWYSIEGLKPVLKCPRCIKNFNIPAHDPDAIQWSYKTFGPFSIPQHASGAYSVLLTLLFFTEIFDDHSRTTPILSFEAKKNSKKLEADLGLLLQSKGRKGNTLTNTIFTENKSFNDFEAKDVNKMMELGKNFPGSILVFATLKNELNSEEKKLIRKVAKHGRKYWKSEHTINPVLILTGNELFSKHGIPYCWDENNPKYKPFIKKHDHFCELIHLADTTQQLYLDMESSDSELEKKLKKNKERRELKRLANKKTNE